MAHRCVPLSVRKYYNSQLPTPNSQRGMGLLPALRRDQDVQGAGIGAELAHPGRKCVLLQDESDDVRVGLGGKASWAFGRHQFLNSRGQLANFHVTPQEREALADEARRSVVTAQIVAVTSDARLLIRRPSAFSLRVRVHPIPYRPRLCRHGQEPTADCWPSTAADATDHFRSVTHLLIS